ncbi:MAG TPA: DinB family protein [Rhodothermales bacterium]
MPLADFSRSSSSRRSAPEVGLRTALLDQIAYLASEADALQTMISRLPGAVLETHPIPGEMSVKELYALLLRYDEELHRPFVDDLLRGANPSLSLRKPHDLIAGSPWNQIPISQILSRLAESRRQLVARCEAAPDADWARIGTAYGEAVDLFAYLFHVVQHDVEILRALGERLHEARLSDRLVGFAG